MGAPTLLLFLWVSFVAGQTSYDNGLWTPSTTSSWQAASTECDCEETTTSYWEPTTTSYYVEPTTYYESWTQVTTCYTQDNVIVTVTTWVPCSTPYYPPETETETVTSTYCDECEQPTTTYCEECDQPTDPVVTDPQPISTTTYTENGATYVVVIMPSTPQSGATDVVTTTEGDIAATASQALDLTSAAEPTQVKNSLLGFVCGLVVLSIWL